MSDLKPITRSEQYMSAISGEYDGNISPPITRTEKIMKAIYDRLGNMDISSSPEKIGQAMEEYSKTHSEFWGNIPDGTITRAKLADEVPEQIRDETLKPISTDEIVSIFNSVFHN